jgi:hypothetical protein
MQEYVIAMKNGHSFRVLIKDFSLFTSDLQKAIDPRATNNFYSQGGVMFNISDVSAIYPLSAQHRVHQTAGGRGSKKSKLGVPAAGNA